MANICDNTFYAYSEDLDNIKVIKDFFDNWFGAYYEENDNSLSVSFDSKWVFPEEDMEKLYNRIPNKKDIFMRCLSVEYGCDYIAYYKCDKNGWYSVI